MTTTIDGDSVRSTPTDIDDTDSPYTTSGEDRIYVDTSNGTVTITLASADVQDGKEVRIIDVGENASSNNITINTEGSENINPGSNSSITLTVDGTYVDLFSDGSNWFSDRADEKQSITTDDVDIGSNDLIASGDFVGLGPSISADGATEFSTTSTSYVSSHTQGGASWDEFVTTGGQGSVVTTFNPQSSSGDYRVRNATDGETVHESLNVSSGGMQKIGATNYTPTTTAAAAFELQVKTDDGGTATEVGFATVAMGVQV